MSKLSWPQITAVLSDGAKLLDHKANYQWDDAMIDGNEARRWMGAFEGTTTKTQFPGSCLSSRGILFSRLEWIESREQYCSVSVRSDGLCLEGFAPRQKIGNFLAG